MTARERAIEIVWKMQARAYTRAMFRLLLDDAGEVGDTLRKLVDGIAEGIEEDRKAQQKASAPS
jgi:hypothetical protein